MTHAHAFFAVKKTLLTNKSEFQIDLDSIFILCFGTSHQTQRKIFKTKITKVENTGLQFRVAFN